MRDGDAADDDANGDHQPCQAIVIGPSSIVGSMPMVITDESTLPAAACAFEVSGA